MARHIHHMLRYGFFAVIAGLLFAFVFGVFVMLLWNWLMPAIFGLPIIGFWQAWGLLVLTHILFKGGAGHHHPSHGFHRSLCDEQHANWRDHFRAKMRQHMEAGERGCCGPEMPQEKS